MLKRVNLKRNKRAVLAAVLCVAIPGSIGSSLLLGKSPLTAWQDAGAVLGLLEMRSPGERTVAELTKTKRAKPGDAGIVEKERALGKEFPPDAQPAFATPEELLALVDIPGIEDVAEDDGSFGNGAEVGGFPFTYGLIAGGSAPGTGGPGAGGPGTGGPGGGGTIDGNNPPPVPPAVPEPETWAMMLLGMGLCGVMLRRRTRRKTSGAALACGLS